MGNKSHRGRGALVALCTALIPAAADAQDAAGDRIGAIERQIRNLQSELQQLKNDLGEAKQQLKQSRGEVQRSKEEARQAQQAAEQARQDAVKAANAESQATQAAAQAQAALAAPPTPSVAGKGIEVGFPGGRPTISTSDGRMSFAIGNQTQFDYGTYYQNPNSNTQFPNLNNGVNLRRERIFFVAKFDQFTFNVTPDFGGSPDGVNTNQTLYEANLNFTGFKPLTATLGYFKPWFSLYDSQSSNDFLLMERPSIIEISRNVAAGDARATFPSIKASNDGISLPWGSGSYFAALAFTGAPYGAQTSNFLNGEQLGMVGRLAGRPYYDEDWNFHVDVSGENVFHPNINASGTPGVSRETLSFGDRPEDRAADQNKLINTGSLSSSSANVIGGEVAGNWRNLLLQGGYYQINDIQSKLPGVPAPGLSFNGGYVEAGWNITGEPFRYNVGSAAFARPKVDDPFIINENGFSPGIGAWQLGARWSVMNLNSNVTPGVSQSKTGGIFGGYQQIFGAALSWYPNDWIRFEMQFQYSMVDKLNSLGTVQVGQKFSTLAGRMQVAF
jgi:phosphate-selective porin OprO and OprP